MHEINFDDLTYSVGKVNNIFQPISFINDAYFACISENL